MKIIATVFNAFISAIGGASMVKFLIRRTLAAVPVLFAIMVVTFGLSQALPGGPFDAVNQRPMPDHVRAQLEQRYGLDKALFFNAPSDGLGTDTRWGEQSYVKGGFGEETQITGKYDELENAGFSVYREYKLYQWDAVTQEYVEYVENPYEDWRNAEAVALSDTVSMFANTLTGVPTVTVMALGTDVHHGSTQEVTQNYTDTYVQDCRAYRNLPGWSILAKRYDCRTVGGTTSRLFNEVNVGTIIDPLDSQFWGYVWNAIQLDFGPSLNVAQIRENTQVIDEIETRLPVSMKLGLVSVVFGFLLGIPLGVLAAIYHNTAIDYVATFFAILGASTPGIVLAPILLIVFVVQLDLVPPPDPLIWRDNQSMFSWSFDLLGAMILPVAALGTGMSAGIARLTRASLLQVLNEDYIRTARAKGLRERSVIYIHALKNSLIPVATILGPLLAAVLTGTFIIERIFTIPGLGESFIDGVAARDYTTIMAVTILYSVFLIAGNIMVDVIYTWLDPRIRFD